MYSVLLEAFLIHWTPLWCIGSRSGALHCIRFVSGSIGSRSVALLHWKHLGCIGSRSVAPGVAPIHWKMLRCIGRRSGALDCIGFVSGSIGSRSVALGVALIH